MQDEVDEKTVSLMIQGGRVTADVLRFSIRQYMNAASEKYQKGGTEKNGEKAIHRGRKSLKEMMREGSELSNIEITNDNIKSFEKVARKYSIDYSLKKDKSKDPPRYYVFFRAKDVEVMNAAFKEYAGASLKKTKKVSLRKKLVNAIQRQAQHRQREKTHQKDRGQSL